MVAGSGVLDHSGLEPNVDVQAIVPLNKEASVLFPYLVPKLRAYFTQMTRAVHAF